MGTPAHPTVSAVIPVHNGEGLVSGAVRSVLAQTHAVLECIVVDDGSSDRSAAIAEELGATVVRQPQSGVSAARNRGAGVAQGEFVAFLDHDDEWLPQKLARQLPGFADPQIALMMCAVELVGTERGRKGLGPVDRLVEGMLLFDGTETVSCSSTGVVRRDAFVAMGGFDEQLSMSADWDLLLRMLLEHDVGYVDEALIRYRVHGANMSRDVALMERDMARAFDKAFAHPALPAQLAARRGEAYGRLHRMLAGSYRDRRQLGRAVRSLATSWRYRSR
jgi:glycosyltransferase involved in cell wall biosynthesis